ncbi:MAG: hypothetical protein ACHQIM_14665 [Sphingobacteriales bacterium]
MSALYIVGGIVSLIFGIWLCVKEVKVFIMGKQDKLGADIKILSGGIGFIMIGLYLIFKYL